MRTRSSSNLPGESSPNPTSSNLKRRNRRSSKQPFILEESPVDTMADQRTMAESLRAPTEGAACRWLKKEPPRSILTWEDLVSKFINEFFPPSRTTNLRNEISNFQQRFDESFHEAWDRYKDLLRTCPHHGFTELHQLDTFYNALNPADQDSLNSVVGGNLLERRTQDVLTIIENKSKIAKLTHAVNQQTSAVTTAMTAIRKQFQATPPLASVKAVEEIYVTYGGAHPYYQCLAANGNTFLELRDIIQGYVSAVTVNYNQSNSSYYPLGVANQIRPLGFAQPVVQNNQNQFSQPQGYNRENNFNQDSSYQAPMQQNQVVLLGELEKIKKINEINMKAMQTQINNVKNKLRNEMKTSIQASINTIDGPSIPMPPPFINQEEDERVEETLTNPELAVILKKLPEKLGDLGKFLILCGFSELKCKALSNLGASINLMPLSVWKNLGLIELISTRMTLELANRAICTPAGIARDFFVPVGKFTFLADFVIGDYESDPRVPLILGRPFLWTARALIDVHGEEMIVCDEGGNFLIEKLLDLDSTKDLPYPHNINPLSGSTTSSSSSPDHLLEEFADELAFITFPPKNDDLPSDIESDLKEIEYLLNHDPTKEMDSIIKDSVDEDNFANPNINLVDTIPEIYTDEHAFDYSSPPLYDDYDDDLDEFESDNEYVYDDLFDSKGEKIKESKLLIDDIDILRSSDFLPSPEYDSFLFEDFFEIDALPSTNDEDKVFNVGILIQENLYEFTVQATPEKNVKKLAISHASLILEDFDPPLSNHELPLHKEVLGFETQLSFSSENKEKVFKPGILTSKGVHTSLLVKLSHQGPKDFKVINILESPMEIFPCSYGEDIRTLDVPCLHFYPP
nr:reverse transcriptase domain-containing protein [Tanacetum cinerariifolium]